MTTNLDTLATQTLEAYRQHQQAKAQEAQQAQQAVEQEAAKTLQRKLEEVLSTEFLESVGEPHYSHHVDSYTHTRSTSAYFLFEGQNWHLTPDRGENWKVFTRSPEEERPNHSYFGRGTFSSTTIQARLLILLGEHKESIEKGKAQRAEREQQAAYNRQECAKQEAQREQERQACILEADQEHTRLALLAAQTITTAKQQIWVWPTGTIIKLYVFEYCRGSYRDEDGDDHFDYDDGWTASDHLSNGWITLENASHEKQRTIKLSSNALHTWTIHTFSSTEELPRVLKEDVTAHLPQVFTRQNYEDGEAAGRTQRGREAVLR